MHFDHDWKLIEDKNDLFPKVVKLPFNPKIVNLDDYLEDLLTPLSSGVIPTHQKSMVEARRMAAANMQHPFTRKDMEAFVQTMEDPEDKEHYRLFWLNSQHIVDKEAELTLWENPMELKFIKSNGPTRNKAGYLRGRYGVLVTPKRNPSSWFTDDVAADWVRQNISETSRAMVHKNAEEVETTVRGSHNERVKGFVSVEDVNTKKGLDYDDRQVSLVKYVPGRSKRKRNGKGNVTMPDQWRGVLKGETPEIRSSRRWDKTYQIVTNCSGGLPSVRTASICPHKIAVSTANFVFRAAEVYQLYHDKTSLSIAKSGYVTQ